MTNAKYQNKVQCSKCKITVGYISDDYIFDTDILCASCNCGRAKKQKKKKTKTVRTASSNYAKTKGGIRPDVHPSYYFRSATEANVARIFNHLNIKWKFEERVFTFTGYKTKPFVYVMDFEITKIDHRKKLPDGLSEGFVEVKGWMNPSSRQKLRRLRKQFPDEADKTTVIIYDKYRKKDIKFCEQLKYNYMFYDKLTKQYKDEIIGWE